MTDLRFPIGKFSFPEHVDENQRQAWIADIAQVPQQLREAVARLSAEQLDTPYRPEGWTLRQVVHHLPDSHMNSYIRFKLALTEDKPTIKPYAEAAWAELPDAKEDIAVSLVLLESLHARWVQLLKTIEGEAWQRSFMHPESQRLTSLERALAIYSWHGKHHIAHINSLRERMGW
ncbi:MAG: bacillithiol transferase BstA [Deinococcales bacterium]